MLSISAMGSGSYYINLAKEDYFLNGGEPPGHWYGKGAEELELAGTIEKQTFRNIVAGKSPDGWTSLTQQQSDKSRQTGWDLTFSAPKSLSALWSQAPAAVRAELDKHQLDSVKWVLDYAEKNVLRTRRGRGGYVKEPVAGAVFAIFPHMTSRAGDPNRHYHALCINTCIREAGPPGTLWSYDLYINKMLLGSLFRLHVAHRLSTAPTLRLPIRKEQSWYEVDGVPKQPCDYWSKRSEEIRSLAKKYGAFSQEALNHFAVGTRHRKGHIAAEDAFEKWRKEGQKLGFSEREVRTLLERAQQQPVERPTAEQKQDLMKEAANQAVEELSEHYAFFSEAYILTQTANNLVDSTLSPEDAIEATRAKLNELVTLDAQYYGKPLYTTHEQYEAERKLIDLAKTYGHDCVQHVPDVLHVENAVKQVERELSKKLGQAASFSKEQLDALNHVVASPGRVQLLQGLAGTGKTETTLRAARISLEAAGMKVIGCASYGKQQAELFQKTGIPSTTIGRMRYELETTPAEKARENLGHAPKEMLREGLRKYIHPPRKRKFSKAVKQKTKEVVRDILDADNELKSIKLTKKTVVVVDEGAIVNTADYLALLEHVEKAGAKIIFVGDRFQLPAIGAGGPFAHLCDEIGCAAITEIIRQEHEWQRTALKDILLDEPLKALEAYAFHGCVEAADTQDEAIDRLVNDWITDPSKAKDKLILAATNEEAALLNNRIQAERRARGQNRIGSLRLASGQRLRTHDRVLFTENSRKLGVWNGQTGSVVDIRRPRGCMGPGHVVVKLDDSTRKGLYWESHFVTVDLKEYKSLELGYAMTTHKSQGVTVDKAYVMLDDTRQNKELTFVQLSRAKKMTKLYTTIEAAGEEFSELATQMKRSYQNELAHQIESQQREQRERTSYSV